MAWVRLVEHITHLLYKWYNDSMNINFYHVENEDIAINTDAILEDGKLLLDGFDYGKRVEEIRGMGKEYEYKLSFDEKNTAKFFEALGVKDKSDSEKLAALKEKFGEKGSLPEIEKYCDEHGITTEFFCWP